MPESAHAGDRTNTQIVRHEMLEKPIIRRKSLSALNRGGTRTVIDFGDAGQIITDEPIDQGGTNDGPTPLQAVVGALCGCESVTFHRTAEDQGFAYREIAFQARIPHRHPRPNGSARCAATLPDSARSL